MNQTEYLNKSQSLAQNLENFIASYLEETSLQKFTVAGFVPMKREPVWFDNFSLMTQKGILSLPRIDGPSQMSFIQSDWKDLVEKNINWKTELKGKNTESFDLILVPGIAFGQNGERLGRGKGFYDRFLESSKALKIGICFEEQIIENVPTEKWDINMDYIITNQRLIKCKGDK